MGCKLWLVFGIGSWFLAKSLLFLNILSFQAENFLTSPLKGEGRALPLPYKQQIIDRYGYCVETTPLEIQTSYLARTLVLGYTYLICRPLNTSFPPLEYSLSPYIDLNMGLYVLRVVASVLVIGIWFLGKSLLFEHIL